MSVYNVILPSGVLVHLCDKHKEEERKKLPTFNMRKDRHDIYGNAVDHRFFLQVNGLTNLPCDYCRWDKKKK